MRLGRFGLATALAASVAIGASGEPTPEQGAASPGKEPVACGTAGVDVTVALSYDHNALGKVAGAYLDLGFRPPLALPDPPTEDQLRLRLKSLMAPEYRIAPTKPERQGTLRVAMTTSEPGIPARDAFKLRVDCPAGSRVRPDDVSCSTDQVVDASGLPMSAEMARQVRCLVVGLESVASTVTSPK